MKKIATLITALLIAATAFAQEQTQTQTQTSGSDSLKSSVNKAIEAGKTAAATAISAGVDVLDNLGTEETATQVAKRKGAKVKLDSTILSADQQKLFLSNISGQDYNDLWASYAKNAHTGKILVISGATVAGIGAFVACIGLVTGTVGAIVSPLDDAEMAKNGFGTFGSGMCVAGVGVIAAGVGIPILVSANRKMSAICTEYNSASERIDKELILGPTSNGIGLAFRF